MIVSDKIQLFSPPSFVIICNYIIIWVSLMAQRLKRLPAMQETWVRSLDWEDPLEKEMATHSSILAWRIPWTEEPGGLQSTGSQRVGHDWTTSLSSQWYHPIISSSVTPFSCPQSFQWKSFPMSWLFTSGGQSIGATGSVLPMNIQGWFPSGLTGLISLQVF